VTILDDAEAISLLRDGVLTIEGRLVQASNATLYGTVVRDGVTAECVYKPVAGERPLWDFPEGSLAAREVAAFAVSEAMGWGVVPPTVMRDGPFGRGMVQLWVDVDDTVELVDVVPRRSVPPGWRPVFDATGTGGRPVTLAHADDVRLRRMAVFDVVINNADRKGGHVLPRSDGKVFGCDHGVCFNVDEKLRTVLWGWAGQKIGAPARTVLERLCQQLDSDLGQALSDLLTRTEVEATRRRVRRLLRTGVFPSPGDGWPAIPWPPF
jgi:uncharacterized repeat protein (TIGR03843 family)